jgi:hypothetical protein
VTHPWGVENWRLPPPLTWAPGSATPTTGAASPHSECRPVTAGTFELERILYSPKQWVFLKADPANINLAPLADPIEKTYMVGDGVTPLR